MMKKIKSIFLLPIICLCLFLVGCKHQDRIKDIHVIDNGQVSYSINGFNYDNYQVELVYESGKKEILPLRDDMVDDHDKLLFYKSGTHEIKVNYKNCKTTFDVIIDLNTFSDDIKFENKTVTFDGEAHKLEVTGDLPEGTKVIYKQGNEFTSAAVYDLNATLVCEGYYIKNLTATLTIEKATYNLDDIKFEDKEFVFDEKTKRIELEGTLPRGLQVSYEMSYVDYYTDEKVTEKRNSAINAGVYEVTASFINSNTNYKNVEPMTATMNIKKAKYDLSDLKFLDEEFVYDGKAHSIGISTEKISHLIGDPKEIILYYASDDDPLSEGKIEYVNVGKYEITATFIILNPNMEDIPDLTATLTIKPSLLDLRDVEFKSEQFEYKNSYDADEAKPTIYCNADKNNCPETEIYELPIGVLFKGYKLEGSDVLLDKITQTEVGIYMYYAVFECGDSNYAIDDYYSVFAFLEITPMEYFIEGVEFKDTTVEYSGSEQSIEFSFLYAGSILPDGIEVVYGGDGNTHIDVGTYNVTVEFVSTSDNFIIKNTMMNAVFTIKPKQMELTYTDGEAIIVDDIVAEYNPNKTYKIEVDESRLPENAQVVYKLMILGYKDDLQINEKKNAGSYPYVITFKSLDKNIIYTNRIEATMVIEPKVVDITSDIVFVDKMYVYNPAGVTFSYSYSKSTSEERIALIEEIAVPTIEDLITGEISNSRYITKYTPDAYYFNLSFESNNENYRVIYENYDAIIITISDQVEPISFSDVTVDFDGQNKMINYKLNSLMSDEDKKIFNSDAKITYTYKGVSYTIDTLPKFKDAGSYEITINVVVPDTLLAYINCSKTATLTIKPLEIDLGSSLYFVNVTQDCGLEAEDDYIKTEIGFDENLVFYPSFGILMTMDPNFKDNLKIGLFSIYYPDEIFMTNLSEIVNSSTVTTSFRAQGYMEYVLGMGVEYANDNFIINYDSRFQIVNVHSI